MLTSEKYKEMLVAVKEDRMYDWVAMNFYELSSWECEDIMLEYIYAVHKMYAFPYTDSDVVMDEVYENLKSYLLDEDEE